MAVLEIDFQPKQPSKPDFDYPRFKAEYLRRKKLSVFQRINEDAAHAPQPEPLLTADGNPYWVAFQQEPGITNLISKWQQERYIDPDTGHVRYTQSVLDLVRHPVVEPSALAVIEEQAQLLRATHGRTYLTPDEFRILNLSKRYLAEADQHELRHKYYGFEPKYRRDGSLCDDLMHGWISRQTGYAVAHIETLLITCENVYQMRAVLGLEHAPDVRIAPDRRRDQSAAKAA